MLRTISTLIRFRRRVLENIHKMSVDKVFPEWSNITDGEVRKELMKTFFETCKTSDQLPSLWKSLRTVSHSQNDTEVSILCANMALKLYDPVNGNIEYPDLLLSYSNKASLILTPFENYFLDNAVNEKTYDLFAVILKNLWLCGVVCSKLNKNDECMDYLSRASKIGDASFSVFDKCSDILSVLCAVENELALCNKRLGMPDEKIVGHFRKATDIQEMYSDEYDIDFRRACLNLSIGYLRLCNYDEAMTFFSKANKICAVSGGHEKAIKEMHLQVGIVYYYLGQAYLELKEPMVAAKCYNKAKEIMDAKLGPYHESSIKVCQGLLLAYKDMGSHSEATRVEEMVNKRLKRQEQEPNIREELDQAVREARMYPFNP